MWLEQDCWNLITKYYLSILFKSGGLVFSNCKAMFQFFIYFGFPFGMMPNIFFIIIIEEKQGNYESSDKEKGFQQYKDNHSIGSHFWTKMAQ